MNLTLADVLPIATFVAQRPRLEAEVMATKALRRLAVGNHMTLLFENRATCLWQIQEMCRVEQITAVAAVQHELDTYNALLPTQGDLSATLLIEVEDPTERASVLGRLVGLHRSVSLNLAGQTPAPARFDGEQFDEVRVSSVQFVRIALSRSHVAALRDLGVPATLAIDHPAYPVCVALPLTLRAALVEDLLTV